MRTIKFRGKCTKESRYKGEWVEEGGLIQCENGETLLLWAKTDHCTITYHVIPESVGQCTGLTDIHGKDIYEGDIVIAYFQEPSEDKSLFGEVVYNNSLCSFNIYIHPWQDSDGSDRGMYVTPFRSAFVYEVVGNIHDNPTLIREMREAYKNNKE